VILIPATKYGTLRFREQVIGGKLLSRDEDPRYQKYVLQKVTDGEGRFTFENVPPGKYYAVSHIFWEIPTNVNRLQGGKVFREIEVQNEKTVEVMLSL
jgi:hypothetical protein